MPRSQSAMEYMVTYGWAILIIVLAVSLLYFFVLQPNIISPNACSFTVQLTCTDVVLGASSAGIPGNLILTITNSQQYPIQNPALFANVNGTNTTKAQCLPSAVPSGGVMLCILPVKNKVNLNALLSGKLYLNASYCGFGANITAINACTSNVPQTYVGVFTAHAQTSISNTPVTVSLTGSNSAYANSVVALSATVKLLGSTIPGVVVNFTENSGIPSLRPQYATTSYSGVAQSYLKSPSALSVTVTATAFGVSNSISVTFLSSPTTTVLTTVPSTYYVPITLTNSQSSATPSTFQQMIVVDSATYSSYINSNWDNVEFTTGPDATGSVLQAWIESNASNTASATVVWVKLASSISGSGGTQTIYMNFVQTSELSSSGPTGEAPALSSTYGQYDNGGDVFNYYQEWGGLSSLPSGWSSSTTFWTFNSKNTTFTSSTRDGIWMTIPSSLSSYPYVWDFYGNMYISTSSPGTYIGGYGSSPSSLCCNIEYSLLEGYGHSPPVINIVSDNNGQYFSTSMSDTNNSKVYTFWASSSSTAGVYLNYQGTYSTTGITSTTPGYFIATTASGSTLTLYWLRTRAYPPSGVMPSVSFGSLA